MFMFTPQQIKRLRDALDLTQTGFAARIGVTEYAVRLWELGKRHPRYATLEKLNKLAIEAGFDLADGQVPA